jgi:opacity protein-like surface antigen
LRGFVAMALVIMAAVPAAAQTATTLRTRRVEVTAGGGWLGGAGLLAGDANLRAAAPPPATLRLFSFDARLAAAPTFHVRAGVTLNRRVGVEGGLTVSHPELRASVSNDAEAAPPITVAERVDQYSVDASVVLMIRELGFGQRTLPFVTAGVGYLRQLHEEQTVVEQGHAFHAGGGVKHWIVTRNQGLIKGAGLRADARLYLMSGGIAFEDHLRPHTAISGSVFLMF